MKKFDNFNLAFEDNNGELGIWLSTPELPKLLVEPFAFYRQCFSISDGEPFLYESPRKLTSDTSFLVSILIDRTAAMWTIRNIESDEPPLFYRVKLNIYFYMVSAAISDLYVAIGTGKKTCYPKWVTEKKLSCAMHSLGYRITLASGSCLETQKLPNEHFYMSVNDDPNKPYKKEIPFKIGIGSCKISARLSKKSKNLNDIRIQLEQLIHRGSAEIELDYEDTQSTIKLKREMVFVEYKELDGHQLYKMDQCLKVEIIPDEYLNEPTLFGFAEEKQVIAEIYGALLYIAVEGNKLKNKELFYNTIKSWIIEDYLSGETHQKNGVQLRQVVVKHAYTIMLGNDRQFVDNDHSGLTYNQKDELQFCDSNNNVVCKMIVPGFEEWYNQFITSANFANACLPADFDLEEWHTEGMDLAKEIRRQLPEEYDLWYGYPYEDAKNRYKRPKLIY